MNQNVKPTKINKVNLATFKGPVLEDLKDIEIQLKNLLDSQFGQVNFNALTMAKKSENIRSSFKMSKAYGEYKVVNEYVKLLETIEKGNFNNNMEYRKPIEIGLMVTLQLMSHTEKLTENQDYYSANLWKSWKKMNEYFGNKDLNINDLFVPCGNINDVRIKKAKKEDVEKIVNNFLPKLEDAILNYESTTTKSTAITALNKIKDILIVLENIKNSSSFHEYWIALKARFALALEDENIELDKKNSLVEILNDFKINIYNFSSGSKHVKYELLEKVCFSLLTERAKSCFENVPEVYEFYKRFYVEDFFEISEDILEKYDDSDVFIEINNENFELIKQDLTIIANKFKDLEKNEDDKDDLLKLIKNFASESKLERFGKKLKDNEVSLILGGYINLYKKIYSIKNIKTPFSHLLSLEFSAFHIISEFYIDKKGDVPSDYISSLQNSLDRLSFALDKNYDALKKAPANKWSKLVNEKLNQELYAEIMTDLKNHLLKIKVAYKNFTNKNTEEILFSSLKNISSNDNDRDNKKVINAFNTLISEGEDFKYVEPLLRIMGFKYAAKLINAICVMIKGVEKNGRKLPNKDSNEIFSIALGACEIFFEDVINGEPHPEKILEKPFRKIYNVENLEIKLDNPNFSFIPLQDKIRMEAEEEEKLFTSENDNEERSNDIISDDNNSTYNDKLENLRNSESFDNVGQFSELKSENISMGGKSDEEDDEYEKEKREESEKKIKELSPHEISFDPEDEEFYVMDYIEEILSEDIKSVFDENISILNADPDNKKAFKEIRRIFHTWKGSGKQVNMYSLGYVGEALNHLYDQRMDLNIPWNEALERTAQVTFNNFCYWAEELMNNNKVFFDPSEVFAALREEEVYYESHYGNKEADNVELTSEISIPSADEVLGNKNNDIIEDSTVEKIVEVDESNVINENKEHESIAVENIQSESDMESEIIVPVNNEENYSKIVEEEFSDDNDSERSNEEELFIAKSEADHLEDATIKLSDINEDIDFDHSKQKIEQKDLTISSLKILSADFEDEDSNDNDEGLISEEKSLKEEVSLEHTEYALENYERLKNSPQEIVENSVEPDFYKQICKEIIFEIYDSINFIESEYTVKDLFIKETLPKIIQVMKEDDLSKESEIFNDIFVDLEGESLYPNHVRLIKDNLNIVIDYLEERTNQSKSFLRDSIIALEEAIFENNDNVVDEHKELEVLGDNKVEIINSSDNQELSEQEHTEIYPSSNLGDNELLNEVGDKKSTSEIQNNNYEDESIIENEDKKIEAEKLCNEKLDLIIQELLEIKNNVDNIKQIMKEVEDIKEMLT